MYNKRRGTSGVRGQLYETKLLSLLLFRAQHHDLVEDFYLATNVEGNGAFDDICLLVNLKEHKRPIAVFIQAKHIENDDKVLTMNSRNDLAKYFESFIKIKQKFDIDSADDFFRRDYKDTDCIFVLYTTKKGHFKKVFNSSYSDIINELIATGDLGCQPLYTMEDLEFLCKISMKEEIKKLATRFVAYIYNKNNDMNDELILRYHVLLAKKVVNVSDIQPNGRRVAKFRMDFFSSKDDELLLIKDTLFEGVLSKHSSVQKGEIVSEISIIESLTSFFSEPGEYTLGQLFLKNIVTLKNKQLTFVNKQPLKLVEKLERVNLPASVIDNAIVSGVKRILKHFQFEVPAVFGNKDLTLKGNPEKIERRLDYLTDQVLLLFEKCSNNNIVIINENDIVAKLFRVNGGLDSAVGNALVLDEKTKLLQFNDNLPRLERHSKTLIEKLTSKISNLFKYRLDVRLVNFPKLFFECSDEDLAKDFFSKLIFYTNQEDEASVGHILKQEIDDHEGTNTKHFRVKSDAIFHNFHVEIQNWWLMKKEAKYLRKHSDFYEKAKDSIIHDPMASVISMMYLNEIRNAECQFKENPTTSLKSVDLHARNIIVTDITRLTFIKLIHNIRSDAYIVLHLKYAQSLPTSDLRGLATELDNTNNEKMIIIVCDKTLHRNFLVIARAVQDKNIIVITEKSFLDTIKRHFSGAKIINDEGNSLFDLSEQSQQSITQKSSAIFQGQEVNLNLLIDDESTAFIKGAVLSKILRGKTITIGNALELPTSPIELMNYDTKGLKYEINDLFVYRRVIQGKSKDLQHRGQVLHTLHDIKDDVVLITAKPGMGKTTLLSFLSIKTKQLNKELWLIRLNLLDYSKHFNTWKENKIVINTLEVLKFLCQVIATKSRGGSNMSVVLIEDSGAVYIKDSLDDEWLMFELNLFLHYYKNKKIIFMFDGFDEICPNYENEVISFLNTIRHSQQKHKIWLTSRPYNKIKSMLLNNFNISEPYELIPFTENEQEIYFEKFWKHNLVLDELNGAQLQNIKDFLVHVKDSPNYKYAKNFVRVNKPQSFLLNKVYLHFLVYLQKQVQLLPMAFPLEDTYKNLLNFSTRRIKYSLQQYKNYVEDKVIEEMLEFVGTPLHMYLVGDYFLCSIKEDGENAQEWDLDVNTYAIYESFLVSKLKKIRFEDKNKMDIHNPDVIETYKTVRKEFINSHKKLAAYAIFHLNGQKIFNADDINEIKAMIENIEKGGEKTGLIYNVSNNIPQFIHMTFTEYFAVEYVCDLLKTEKNVEQQESICYFIINSMFYDSPANVLNIMDLKVKMDTEFAAAIVKNKTYIFKILISQNASAEEDSGGGNNNIKPLNEAVKRNLNIFLSIFMSTLEENVNENNLDDYLKCVGASGFLRVAVANMYDDVLKSVLRIIRRYDVSKWRKFISEPRNYCDDIVTKVRIHRLLRYHFKEFFDWSLMLDQRLLVINDGAA